MTTRSLPFVVKPPEPTEPFAAVGDEKVGILHIPLYGWLTGAESDMIGSIDPENRQYIETCMAAVELSKATDMEVTDAYQSVANIVASFYGTGQSLSKEDQALKITHWQLVLPLARLAAEMVTDQTIRRVTAMVRRLEGCQDWTDADSRQLPPALRIGISEVAWREELAMAPQATPEANARQLVEDLGKPQPEPSAPPDPTGESFTGSSETSTQPIPMAAESDSVASPPRTSSKRSSGATSAAATTATPQS